MYNVTMCKAQYPNHSSGVAFNVCPFCKHEFKYAEITHIAFAADLHWFNCKCGGTYARPKDEYEDILRSSIDTSSKTEEEIRTLIDAKK